MPLDSSPFTHPRQAGVAHGLVLLAAAVMPIMAITALIPVLPLMLSEFASVQGSEVLVPIALTIPALCVAVFSPIAGWLSDRIGRKRLLVGALTLYAAVGFAPWFMRDLGAIIGARIGLGVLEATIMTMATALIGDYFAGERRERWIALQVMLSSIVATVLLAAGGMLGDLFGSRGPFLLYLSSIAVAGAAALVLHEPVRQSKSGRKADPTQSAMAAVLPLALVTLGVGFVFYTIFVEIGPILESSGRVTPGQVGLAGAILNLGVVAGAVVFRRISSRSGPGPLAAGLVIAALGYGGVALSTGFVAITAFATLSCLGTGLLLPNMLAWTMRSLPPAVRGQGTGIWTGAFFLGQFVAPLVAGALAAPMDGLRNVVAALAVVILAAALATIVIARGRLFGELKSAAEESVPPIVENA